jgi:chromosome segregation protein
VRPQVQPTEFRPRFNAAKGVETVDAVARESAPLLDYRALSEKDIREELAKVESARANLGEVNPLAPREYSERSQRLAFLQKQEQDLQLAAADMQAMLEKLEAQTREQFAAALKHIEAKFNELFVRLFGGGYARFRLTDPEDLTSSGVEIEVQLPNGRRQNLKALSGGERSLLFIALFIAVHMVRPGSFCVLDEVDAALDDINVARLLRLLQELSQQEQFVVITHNKHTMKVMQRLVGVVTQPRGISRVLEVTLKQAESYVGSEAQ